VTLRRPTHARMVVTPRRSRKDISADVFR
jgi:hypothetical protein